MSDLAPSIRPLSDRLSWPPGVPVPGDIIGGKYLCERLLGAGGMGAVIGARHEQLGQQVAIKVLLPSALTDPLASERFLREARAAISFRSDHVARVIDFGTLDAGSPYLVMEHLEGSDLKDLISRKGPLPVASAIDYIMQACEALCEAHRRGIVHRDLKPANLFLSSRVDGTPHVKVLDFGISKTVSLAAASTGSGGGITRTDAVFGTPAYMSPETDLEGFSGFSDDVDNHYAKIFGSAFIMGAIFGGTSLAAGSQNTNPYQQSAGATMANQVGAQMAQAGIQVINKGLNIPPTIVIHKGYQFDVSLTADLVLKPYIYKNGDDN